MRRSLLKSAGVGFLMSAVLGATVVVLTSYLGKLGEMLALLYFIPGQVLAPPCAPLMDMIYKGLFPGYGAPGATTEAIPLAVAFWTVAFGAMVFFLKGARRLGAYE